jgi:hypothetical protein
VLEPRVMPQIIFDNWGFQIFDFGAKMALRSAAPELGRQAPIVKELALGAAPLAPGTQNRATCLLHRVRVLGGSSVGTHDDCLKVYFYCFQSLFYENMIDFVETLIFQMV